ncbi:MAG: UPF0175 family protein [Pyrinomonadaceae bacterium]
MQNISVEIPVTTFAALGESPDEFVNEMRIAAAVKWYEVGRLSQGKAAEVAGLSRSAFIDVLSRYRVSPFQYSAAEVESELNDAD